MPNIEVLSAIPVLPGLDFEESAAFYPEKLGFAVCFRDDECLVVQRDSVRLHLWACEDPGLPGMTQCRLVVRDVASLYAELEPKGVIHPNGHLEDKPWGFRELTALDPSGNALVFVENLADLKPLES